MLTTDSPNRARQIDLRSDAVTTPTDEMWIAMREAHLGWAPSGDDRSIHDLESLSADLVGKEAALFVPTGTMANLLALMTYTKRGDQILLDAESHILWSEEWSLGYVCGVVPNVLPIHSGHVRIEDVQERLSGQRFSHKPKTSLICIESPHNLGGGVLLPTDRIDEIGRLAHSYGIPVHVDGARIFNGCASSGENIKRVVRNADSLMFCLNKGLSAPAGAILCGTASFIEQSKTNLRRLGGHSIPQMGIWAAAGLFALATMLPQLGTDNRRARLLADGISSLATDFEVPHKVETNIVLVSFKKSIISAAEFLQELARRNVLALQSSEHYVRFVTHRHITDDDIDKVLQAIRSLAEC